MAPLKKTRTTAGKASFHAVQETSNDEYSDDMSGEYGQTELKESQGSTNKFQKLITDMVDTQKKRHTARKAAVFQSYKQAHADTEAAIETLFDEHEKEAAQAHANQLARLQYLLGEKVKVEKQMAEKLVHLRAEYLTNSKVLQQVVEHRAKELR